MSQVNPNRKRIRDLREAEQVSQDNYLIVDGQGQESLKIKISNFLQSVFYNITVALKTAVEQVRKIDEDVDGIKSTVEEMQSSVRQDTETTQKNTETVIEKTDEVKGMYAEAADLKAAAETAKQAVETAERVQEAEDVRIENENERIAAEEARKKAESDRVSAETERASAEESRTAAENKRASAEEARASAENERASAESARNDAEDVRVQNEEERVSAEEARKKAEADRAVAESERSSAEASRATAEAGRSSAEKARDTAEKARATAEEARKTAESTRASAEAVREKNETGRVTAETERGEVFDQTIEAAEKATDRANTAAQACEDIENEVGAVRYNLPQNLSDTEKAQARTNMGISKNELSAEIGAVQYKQQSLSDAEKLQAKKNIGLDKVDNTPDSEKDVQSASKLTTPVKINGVQFDGSKDVTVADSTKVAKTGDTMTGDLTFSGAARQVKYVSGSRTGTPIACYAGDQKGSGLVIGDGGRTIIGGGEAAQNLRTALGTTAAAESSEQLHLANDGAINMHTNCQEIAQRKTYTFGTDGSFTAPGDIKGNRVYNPVYADYAEAYNVIEPVEPGDVVAFTGRLDDYGKPLCEKANTGNFTLGVVSDMYGHLIGEYEGSSNTPIALAGRVYVKVIGPVSAGDYLISSVNKGVCIAVSPMDYWETPYFQQYYVGRSFHDKNSKDVGLVLALISK